MKTHNQWSVWQHPASNSVLVVLCFRETPEMQGRISRQRKRECQLRCISSWNVWLQRGDQLQQCALTRSTQKIQESLSVSHGYERAQKYVGLFLSFLCLINSHFSAVSVISCNERSDFSTRKCWWNSQWYLWIVCCVPWWRAGSPNYGPRVKSGPRSHFNRLQRWKK